MNPSDKLAIIYWNMVYAHWDSARYYSVEDDVVFSDQVRIVIGDLINDLYYD